VKWGLQEGGVRGGESVSLLSLAAALSVSLCSLLFLCCVGNIYTPRWALRVTVETLSLQWTDHQTEQHRLCGSVES